MPLLRTKYRTAVSPGGQMRQIRYQRQLVFLILLVLTLAACTGCRFKGIGPFGQNTARLERAEQAFFQKDYPGAREEFTLMMEMATHPDTKDAALYGIACVDMITTENTDAFLTAMDSFLQSSTGENKCREANPQLLTLAVSHGMALMGAERRETSTRIAALSATGKKYKKERLKMQHLIKTLQHQISALESIDQERQEKRKTQ